MKNIAYRMFLMSTVLLMVLSSCKKDKFSKYDNPYWSVETSTDYSVSLTAIVKLPDNLNSYVSSSDQMAAFNGSSCRGIAKMVGDVFYLNVVGVAGESFPITIKYWSASNKYLYEANQRIPFQQNSRIGSPDAPYVLDLTNL